MGGALTPPHLTHARILDITGSLYLVTVFSAMMFGLSCLQTFNYFREWKKDSLALKSFMAFVTFLSVMQMAFYMTASYWYAVSKWGDVQGVAYGYWGLNLALFFSIFIKAAVLEFFAWRVYKLSRGNLGLSLLTGILPLIYLGVSCADVANVISANTVTGIGSRDGFALTTSALTTEMAADIITAGSVTWLLYRSRTGFDASNKMIDSLIIYTINNCMLTVVLAAVTLVVFETDRESLTFLIFHGTLARLYVNSILSALNSRGRLRSDSTQGKASSSGRQEVITIGSRRVNAAGGVEVHVNSFTQRTTDDGFHVEHCEGSESHPDNSFEMSQKV